MRKQIGVLGVIGLVMLLLHLKTAACGVLSLSRILLLLLRFPFWKMQETWHVYMAIRLHCCFSTAIIFTEMIFIFKKNTEDESD